MSTEIIKVIENQKILPIIGKGTVENAIKIRKNIKKEILLIVTYCLIYFIFFFEVLAKVSKEQFRFQRFCQQ